MAKKSSRLLLPKGPALPKVPASLALAMRCMKCRASRDVPVSDVVSTKNHRRMAKGKCPTCNTTCCRFVSSSQWVVWAASGFLYAWNKMHSPPNKRDVKNLSAKIRSAERLYEDLVMRENDEWAPKGPALPKVPASLALESLCPLF